MYGTILVVFAIAILGRMVYIGVMGDEEAFKGDPENRNLALSESIALTQISIISN